MKLISPNKHSFLSAISILNLAVIGNLHAQYETFISNGPNSNRVNMVYLGDGYQASEISTYKDHIGSMMDYFYTQDPFPRYNKFINAHRVDVISNESGADNPRNNIAVDTALDASYNTGGIQRLLYINSGKADAILDAQIAGAFSIDMRMVTVNSSEYGGGGGKYAVFAGANGSSTDVAVHELAHSFGGLADEYYSPGTTHTGSEPSQVNVTADPTGAKWSRWLGYEQEGIGTIGVYEGAKYKETGLYRPSQNSKMRSLFRPFDAISREELILDIYRKVDPLDSWLDNASLLLDPNHLWVDSIDPDVISQEWFIDGNLVEGATGERFDPRQYGYGIGTYTVTARSTDETDWVRYNRDLLTQDVSWNIEILTVPEPSSACFIMIGFAAFMIRKR